MGTKASHSARLRGVAPLDDKLQAADVTGGFLPAFDRPAHLHEGRDRNRRIEYLEITAHKGGSLQRGRAKNAHAAVAQIVDATVKFLGSLGLGARGRSRSQTSCVHFKHLRKPLMLATFTIGEVAHSMTSCPKFPFS